jgi:hypothetical protein
MKTHICDDGTIVDLDAIMAISPVITDYKYVEPHMYSITSPLGGITTIGYDTCDDKEANVCRNKLIKAWLDK